MAGLFVPSPLGAVVFSLIFLAWGVFEVWTNLRGWPAGTRNRDRLSRYVIIGVMLLAFALARLATNLHAFDVPFARSQIFYAGLVLMLAGLLFRAYAIRQLGRYFVPEVAIQPGQRVIDTGLYRFLRHPSYTGSFITILGYGLALTNGLSLALMLVLPGLAFVFRMNVEEAALLEAFGVEYRAYMRRTKRIIPFVY